MKAKNHSAQLWAFLAKVNKQGKVALYIRVTVNRAQRYIPLKLYWPVEYYDFTQHQLLRRSPKDKEYTDYQLILNQELSKCHEVFVQFRLRDLPLTLDIFLEEFHQYNLKRDFVQYMEAKIKSRYKKKEIAEQTKKNHTNTYNKVLEYQKTPLPFEAVTVKWCRSFELWLRKEKKNKVNTIWGHMKDINTYLNLAKEEDQIPLTNPFTTGYSCASVETHVSTLSVADLRELHGYLHSSTIPDNEYVVLRQFLFSCYTGLRISDLKQITADNIVGDTLIFFPVKGKRFDKLQRVPLTRKAKEFILKDITGKLFPVYVDQVCNRLLKRIAAQCKLNKHLTNHVGRHSFATIFLELGGSVEVLQSLLGHSKISTTMRYVHIQESHKETQMGNFDGLDF